MYKYLILLFLCSFSLFGQRFNEVCSVNSSGFRNGYEGYVDWLELYNETESVINMAGYFLTDDLSEPTKWTFPTRNIFPDDYVIITAEENSSYASTVNFPLLRSGGSLYLFSPDGELLDLLDYPELRRNHSYGKIGENWYYFKEPTPLEPNITSTGYKGYASSLTINRPSGFYPKGTHLILRKEGISDEIIYAINGQSIEPGSVYTDPIIINKNFSLKATCRSDSLIDGVLVNRTYFVEENHNLPVVNIILDSLEMFDETVGIYMPGPDAEEELPYKWANFWGDEEIAAHFTYFDTNFVLQESLQCDLKIHGGLGSRVNPMKSLQLRAKDYYEETAFNYPFFKDKSLNQFKRIILRNAGNDYCNGCMKDGVLHNYYLQNDINVDLMAYQPVVLYINGTYWGIQNIREKPDRHYISSNYSIDPETVNLLEHAALDIVDGERESFEEIVEYAVENNLGDLIHFDWVAHRVDLESMVDYFLIEFYANNRDWPNFNLKVWNAPGHKWRYLCYDMDVGFRYNAPTQEEAETMTSVLNNLNESNPHVAILSELLENEEFKRYFINRYADLLNTIYQPDSIFAAFEQSKETVAFDMLEHYEKWCGPYEKWESNFVGVRGFIDGRVQVVRQDIVHAFDKPKGVEIRVDNYPSSAGDVKLNTLELTDFPFSGTYYPTNVIDLEAIPKAGLVFDHWENLRDGKVWHETRIKVNPKEGDQLVAIYRSPEDLYHLSVAPNPVGSQLNLYFSIPEPAQVSVQLVDVTGNLVLAYDYLEVLSKGSHDLSLDVSYLNTGMYLLYLTGGKGRETIQVYKK